MTTVKKVSHESAGSQEIKNVTTKVTIARDVLDTKEKQADLYLRLKAAGRSAHEKYKQARRDTEDAALTRRIG